MSTENPACAIRLSPSEEKFILTNPYGLQLLMDYEDLRFSEAAAIFEPDEVGTWPTARWQTLLERGRSIMAEDLDCWPDDLRKAFRFPTYAGCTAQPVEQTPVSH